MHSHCWPHSRILEIKRYYQTTCWHIYIIDCVIGLYQNGCQVFKTVSPNIAMEESGIKEDKEFSESCQYSEVCLFSLWHLIACVTHLTHLNLVNILEVSIDYLLQAERYETTGEICKLLIPFYEKNRDFKVRKQSRT